MTGPAIDDRLRDALAARARGVDPADRLASIERRLRQARRRRVVLRATAGLAAAAAVVAAVTAVQLRDDGEDVELVPSATTTSAPHVTTSAVDIPPSTIAPATTVTIDATTAPRTAPTTTVLDTAAPDGRPAIWPPPGTLLRSTPEEAALGFARDYLGMGPEVNVVSSEPSLDRSGVIVDVRPRASGRLITRVQTRAVEDGWVVDGAAADVIQLASPLALSTVRSPVALEGTSSTYEGTVYIEVRPLGSIERIGEQTFTNGAASPEPLGPFTATLDLPTAEPGVLVLVLFQADSSGDGVADAATVVPVTVA